jgi:hypothetical protein
MCPSKLRINFLHEGPSRIMIVVLRLVGLGRSGGRAVGHSGGRAVGRSVGGRSGGRAVGRSGGRAVGRWGGGAGA